MNKRFMQYLVALAGLLAGGAAIAADGFSPVVSAAVSYSGDDWQVASTPAGRPITFRGGGRFKVGGGVDWQSSQYPVQATALVNYQYDPRAGANGSAKFSRIPLEGMVYYTGLETVRFGVGLSYVVSPKVKTDVDGDQQSIRYKNAVGSAFEIGYALTPRLWSTLRLSSEKYKPKNAGVAQDADVSSLSLKLSYQF
ncbi:hypothetical protein [Janthinobacterium sp. RB2R34]|uniref:hypothetical protein n=1 Tax=Janthinobacterium sp. RB2R34 TaxID=3424193 RepID=UPI003F22AB98